eukprot:897316_1
MRQKQDPQPLANCPLPWKMANMMPLFKLSDNQKSEVSKCCDLHAEVLRQCDKTKKDAITQGNACIKKLGLERRIKIYSMATGAQIYSWPASSPPTLSAMIKFGMFLADNPDSWEQIQDDLVVIMTSFGDLESIKNMTNHIPQQYKDFANELVTLNGHRASDRNTYDTKQLRCT